MSDDIGVPKARAAILEAYNRLVLKADGKTVRVSEIVREAEIGRSTFYEHFPNADSVLQEAVAVPFRFFAQASLGGDWKRLEGLLSHFMDQAIHARSLFMDARTRDQLVGVLAREYESLLEFEPEVAQEKRWCSIQLSESNLAMVRQWIDGKLVVDAERLSKWIVHCTEQIQDLVKQKL